MESVIKKKQKKRGMLHAHGPQPDMEGDPFEEIYRYLRQLRLRREDCPNPIPWWRVGKFIYESELCLATLF